MGYRSEVAFAIKQALYEKYKELLEESVKDCDQRIERRGIVCFVWSSVKWYDTYPEVKTIEELVENNPENSALLGEEDDDVRTHGYTYDLGLYLNRSISFEPN